MVECTQEEYRRLEGMLKIEVDKVWTDRYINRDKI